MTIPIIPGPFSFLQSLGEGAGKAFKSAEEQKRVIRGQQVEDRAEASKNLMNMIDLYSKGVLKKIDSNALLELGQRAGMSDFLSGNVVPRPENQIAEGRSDFLSTMLGDQGAGPDQAAERQATLATGQIQTPEQLAKSKVSTQAAGVQSAAIEAGGAAGRAVAGVLPEATAIAGEEAPRDSFYGTVAGRTVDAAITPLGGNVLNVDLNKLSESAWKLAQDDARSRNYTLDESLTRPYIDAAIQGRYREALAEKAKIDAAGARAGTDQYDNYLKILQGQQGQIRNQITALPKPDKYTYTLASAYEAAKAKKRTLAEQAQWEQEPSALMMRSAYEAVTKYNETVQSLNNELNGNRDELSNALSQKVSAVGGAVPGRAGTLLDQATVDQYANALKAGQGTVAQLNEAVAAGAISQSDKARIIEQANKGAAARNGGR